MDNSIGFYLKQLNEKRKNMSFYVREMDRKKLLYEEEMRQMSTDVEKLSMEIRSLNELEISIRLGDLLDELSWLADINVNNINVCMSTSIGVYGSYSKEEIVNLINTNEGRRVSSCNHIRFRIYGNLDSINGIPFDYFMFLPICLDSIQADGKLMIEHCSSVVKKDYFGECYSELVVDRDIDNIICNFDLSILEREDFLSWFPNDLIRQAIINCLEREYNSKVDKIRKRVKDI